MGDVAFDAAAYDASAWDASFDVAQDASRDAGLDASRLDAGAPLDAFVPTVDAGMEPPLNVQIADLDASIHCPAQRISPYPPVLLIHGTGANADIACSWGYLFTSIYSTTDQTAVAPTSVVAGALSFSVQTLCPGRTVAHAAMVSDAVVYAAVMDALGNPGPLDPSRLAPSVCATDRAPGVDPAVAVQKEQDGSDLFLSTYFDGTWVVSEPALAAYVSGP